MDLKMKSLQSITVLSLPFFVTQKNRMQYKYKYKYKYQTNYVYDMQVELLYQHLKCSSESWVKSPASALLLSSV